MNKVTDMKKILLITSILWASLVQADLIDDAEKGATE